VVSATDPHGRNLGFLDPVIYSFLNEISVVPPSMPHVLSFFGMSVVYQV
jgi:hypothetical protein